MDECCEKCYGEHHTRDIISNITCSFPVQRALKQPFHLGKQGNITQLGGEFILGPGTSVSPLSQWCLLNLMSTFRQYMRICTQYAAHRRPCRCARAPWGGRCRVPIRLGSCQYPWHWISIEWTHYLLGHCQHYLQTFVPSMPQSVPARLATHLKINSQRHGRQSTFGLFVFFCFGPQKKYII